MQIRRIATVVTVVVAVVALLLATRFALAGPPVEGSTLVVQTAAGTAFTYQGRLTDGGSPADGTYDFEFKLYDAAGDGSQVGSVNKDDVAVTDGLFTVTLDFGSDVFKGDARYLEVGVRPGSGSDDYTILSPRQVLSPAPYALALPGLWTQQNAASPNIIGGFSGNSVISGVVGATIGGGGAPSDVWAGPYPNRVADDYGTVGGGQDNQAGDNSGTPDDAPYSTVGGGLGNTASGATGANGGGATVGGGYYNTASGGGATVAGGGFNTASGTEAAVGGGYHNDAGGGGTAIGGGQDNTAGADFATVGGGVNNTASSFGVVIGGGEGNVVTATLATVGGGSHNIATGDYATICGGYVNGASGEEATVAGGLANEARGSYASVGGGLWNTASGIVATIGGGERNLVTGTIATIGGGLWNTAGGDSATVGGGVWNAASGAVATVSGGSDNTASAEASTVGSGIDNTANHYATTVAGGAHNTASGSGATIGGGGGNTASDWAAAVCGGDFNTASGVYAFIGGGFSNVASGERATVPGGGENTAQGTYSFAAGHRAKANHDGAFVWADSTEADFESTNEDQFGVRATNGAEFSANNTWYGFQIDNDGDGDGLRAYANVAKGDGWAAVYAINSGTSPALYADSNGSYSGYFMDDIYVQGSCVGCRLVYIGLNDGSEVLETGDLVTVSGVSSPLTGATTPVMRVRRASADSAGAVVGVVEGRADVVESNKDGEILQSANRAEGAAARGDYVFIVVQGMAHVKADATVDAIAAGQRLTAADQPGHVRVLRTRMLEGMAVTEGLPVVGIALAPLDKASGTIPVLVTLR